MRIYNNRINENKSTVKTKFSRELCLNKESFFY